MDNKILIKLYVPMIEKNYDLFVPINKKIEQVIQLVGEAISDLTDGGYILKNDTLLCDKMTGKIYDNNLYVKEAGIKNGTELLLI